jgi:hypothetical protein
VNTLAIQADSGTRRSQRQETGACHPRATNFTRILVPQPTVRCTKHLEKCNLRPSRRLRDVLTDRTRRSCQDASLNLQGPLSRVPPFTTAQFHVLLNSLFKVLFNFPSRYLFAIGLGVIFSLTWSLPRTLSCTPKQLDSKGKASTTQQPSYGPITLYGLWPQSRWTWTGRRAARRLPRTPHSTRPRWPAVRCWALPVSFAITKGITVVFFSSAY